MIMHTRLSGCLTLAAEFNMQRLTPSIHSMLLSGIKRAPQLDGRRMAEHRASRNVLSASASVSRGANRKCVELGLPPDPGPLYARRKVAGWLVSIRARAVLKKTVLTLETRNHWKTSSVEHYRVSKVEERKLRLDKNANLASVLARGKYWLDTAMRFVGRFRACDV